MVTTLSVREGKSVPGDSFVILEGALGGGSETPKVGLSLLDAGDMSRGGQARSRLLERLGIDLARLRSAKQVHSTRVIPADEARSPEVEADGMVTACSRDVLAVTFADCLPIVLFDRRSGAYGIVHSGWRGTGIAGVALDLMRRSFGTQARDVAALIGPGVGPCCYSVPEERWLRFRARWGEATGAERDGLFFLDLAGANTGLLERLGVEEIRVASDCTACSDFLGSYRRQGADRYTRMIALVGSFG